MSKDVDPHTDWDLKQVSMLTLELVPVPAAAPWQKVILIQLLLLQNAHTMNLYCFLAGIGVWGCVLDLC